MARSRKECRSFVCVGLRGDISRESTLVVPSKTGCGYKAEVGVGQVDLRTGGCRAFCIVGVSKRKSF
jgi:hypothetical protein